MRRKEYVKRVCLWMSTILCVNMLTSCSRSNEIANSDGTLNAEVYAQPATEIGEQPGWFGQVVKERFGLNLCYRSSGENDFMLYESQEKLGDLIIFDNVSNFREAAGAGLLFDWEDEDLLALHGSKLEENYPEALRRSRSLVIDGRLYGIGSEIATEKGLNGNFACVPELRADLYETLGCPSIDSLKDYIPILSKMQALYPETEKGKKVYGVSLFKDWDDGMMQFCNQLAALYGYEQMGLGYYDHGTQEWESCLSEDGIYIKCLEFYNELYRQGLLDPDSMTQDYSMALTKYQQGTVLFSLIGSLGSALYNTASNLSAGHSMRVVAPCDSVILRYEESIYGNDCIWAIGADCIDPESCMELIEWLFSPEGKLSMMYGPENVTWEYNSDGLAVLTEFGQTCLNDSSAIMPDSELSFGAGYPWMNSATLTNDAKIQGTNNESYLSLMGDNVQTDTTMNDLRALPYVVAPASTFELPERSDQLDFIWVQIANCIQEYSWKAVYAPDDQTFDQIIQKMREKSDAYGWDQCLAWCQEQAKERAFIERQGN